MDITTKAAAKTAAIHLKDADGVHLYSGNDTSKPVRIVVYGPASPEYAAMEAQQVARVLKRREENDGKPAVPTVNQRVDETAEDLASITVAFENFTYPPAGDAQGRDLFRAFYADQSLGYMHQQVLKATQNWGNFSGGSKAASLTN